MKRILEGLKILEKYDPDSDFYAEHDLVYCADATNSKEEMSSEHLKALEDLGWFINEDYDCWTHFC